MRVPGRRPDMHPDRAGVDRREKILPEVRRKAEGQQSDAEEAASERPAMRERQLQQAEVALAQPLETMLEPALEASEEARTAASRRRAA